MKGLDADRSIDVNEDECAGVMSDESTDKFPQRGRIRVCKDEVGNFQGSSL